MKSLLESGVHFGHQTKRWNPKMKPYIYDDRNEIHIIDLEITLKLVEESYEFVKNLTASGGTILFVGTKRQAQDAIKEAADRSDMPYINNRWLGGTITNFNTIRSRIDYLNELKELDESGKISSLTKKEGVKIRKEIKKLENNLGGIVEMDRVPNAVFIIDPKNEYIATAEARKKGVPIVAVVDTNCDPEEVDKIIPGNDDAIRSISLITKTIADAAVEGVSIYKKKAKEEKSKKEKKDKKEENKEKSKKTEKVEKDEKPKKVEKVKDKDKKEETMPAGKQAKKEKKEK